MPTEAAPRRYRCLAVNDEQSSCCCCGRKGLRRVVWLLDLAEPDADPTHYGTTCAAHLLLDLMPADPKPRMSKAERVIAEALAAERERQAAELWARVEALPVPEVTEGTNAHGVKVACCGDAKVPFLGDGWHPDGSPRFVPLARMHDRAVAAWRLRRVFALAISDGLPHEAAYALERVAAEKNS